VDQGTIAASGDRRTWTPLRALLIALGATAGGLLLSVALGGPARADAPSTPPEPAATSTDTSLLGQVTGALTDITRTALAPVDDLVATVPSGPAAGAVPPPPAPPAPAAASAGAIPAALDHVLAEVPVSSTPLWQDLLGPQPVHQLTSPLAAVLRPLAPGAADVLAPVLPAPPASSPPASSALVAASSGSPVAPVPAPLVRGPGAPPAPVAGTAPSAVRHLDDPLPTPRLPLGAPDDVLASMTSGGAMSSAVLVAFAAALLLAGLAARRHGWRLPAAPVFGTDVSPD